MYGSGTFDRNDDHLQALEPDYELVDADLGSIWRMIGRRRVDGLGVVVTVSPRRGSQLNLARAESFFAPLIDSVGLLEVRGVGDDLFLIWEHVGDLGLTDLDPSSLSPHSLTHLTRSVLEALDVWHGLNRSYGFPALRGVRVSEDLQRAWLVEPDLHRVVEGLSLGDSAAERLAFERALATWRGADNSPLRADALFAPHGQRAVFTQLSAWDTSGRCSICYLRAPEGFGKTTLLHALESSWSHDHAAVVFVHALGLSSGAWVHRFLDLLAEHALAMTPLLKRRLIARVRAAIGARASLIAWLSPRWAAALGEEQGASAYPDHAPDPEVVADVIALLMSTFASLRPIALLIDDADEEVGSVDLLMSALDRHGARGVRVVCAVSLDHAPDQSITLEPLRGEELERFVSHTLDHPLEHVGGLCRQLESALTTSAHVTRVALRLARARDWLVVDPSTSALTVEHLDLLSSLGGDPSALLELLGTYQLDVEVLRILSILSSSIPTQLLTLICDRTPGQLRRFVTRARRAGILHERRDTLRLASFTARGVRESIPAADLTRLHRRVASRLLLSDRRALAANHIMAGWPSGQLSAEQLAVLSDLAISETSAGRSRSLSHIVDRLIDAISYAGFSPEAESHARLAIVRSLTARRELARAEPYAVVPAGAPLHAELSILRERVVLRTFSGQYGRALDEGLSALAAAGVNVHATGRRLDEQVTRALEALPRLSALPDADPEESLRQSLIGALLPVAYIARRDAFEPLVSSLVERTLASGVSPDSVRGLTALGQLACVRLGAIAQGTELGFAAYALASRTPGHPFLPIVCSDLANFILPWSGRVDEALRFNRLGRRSADMFGELQYAGYIRMHDLFNRFTYGAPLGALRERARRYVDASSHNALAHNALLGVLGGLSLAATPHPDLYAAPAPSAAPLARHLHHLTHGLIALALDERDALVHHTAAAARHFASTEGWAAPSTLQLYLSALAAYHSGSDDLSTARGALELIAYWVDALGPIVLHVRGLELAASGDDHGACVLFDRAISDARELDLHAYVALVAQDAVSIASRGGLQVFADASRRAAARAFARWGIPRRAAAFGLDVSPSPVLDHSPEALVRASLSAAVDTLRSQANAERCLVAFFVDSIPTVFACVDPSLEDVIQVGESIDHGHPEWRAINRRANSPDALGEPSSLIHRSGGSSLVVVLPGMTTDAASDRADLRPHARAIFSWSHLLQVCSLTSGQLSDASLSMAIGQLADYLFFVGLGGEGVRLDGSTFPLEAALQRATIDAVEDHEPSSRVSSISPGSTRQLHLVCVYFPRVLKLHDHVEPVLWLSQQPLGALA